MSTLIERISNVVSAIGADIKEIYDKISVPSFESVSKNLQSWSATLNYTAGNLTSIVYTNGSQTVTKTFTYTAGALTSITLSGDVPTGIALTKTFNYTAGVLTSVGYS